jgi:DNA-binding transcriptional LysR family regulator
MSDIETRLFRYFVALAEERHFARAAERLGITPPTLTNQIQKLESQVGAKLLDRTGNKNVLTDAGQRFLTEAREALRHGEQAATVARQAQREELGRLDIGFMTAVTCAGLLETWTAEFRRANPAINMAMHLLIPIDQIARIMHKELHAGFTRAPNKYPDGLRGIELHRQPMVLALPSDHPLARRKDIAPAMLKEESFINIDMLQEESSVNISAELDVGYRSHTEVIADLGGFTPRVVKRDDNFITILTYVAQGHGIAVVPQHIRGVHLPNVVFRNIAANPVPFTTIAFVYHRNSSPAANLLIKHMRRYALPQQQIDSSAHNRITSWAAMEKEDELIAPPPIFAPGLRGSGIAHDHAFGES